VAGAWSSATLDFVIPLIRAGCCLTRACSRRAGRALSSARPPPAVSALWNVDLCAGGLEGPQLMRMSLGGRQQGAARRGATQGELVRFSRSVLVALSLGCAGHPDVGTFADLRLRRAACMALDWGAEPRLMWQRQPVPDTLLLLPGDGRSEWPGPSDVSGYIRFLPSNVRQDASSWGWSLSGDTLSMVAFTPTMDDLVITVKSDASDSAVWQIVGLDGRQGGLRVQACELDASAASAA
jgi:hypothetical protein